LDIRHHQGDAGVQQGCCLLAGFGLDDVIPGVDERFGQHQPDQEIILNQKNTLPHDGCVRRGHGWRGGITKHDSETTYGDLRSLYDILGAIVLVMIRNRLANGLLLAPAFIVVVVEVFVVRPAVAALNRIHRVAVLQRLHRRLARLPPGVALPLFLVPEAASRAGWLASAWLLMTGAAWEALMVYVLTKLLATVIALWVYRACEPALLRVGWFARMHTAGHRMRRSLIRPSPRFAEMRHRVRVGALR
jgi:hypothetical protein